MAIPSNWPTLDLLLPQSDPRTTAAVQPSTCLQVGSDTLDLSLSQPAQGNYPFSFSVKPSPFPSQQPTNIFSSFPFLLECLDHSSGRPFYYCAPNDVWSLGVILVNLTCGRNPWKQASFEDSTYGAYTRTPGFLKTILPVSDELNDILSRIFDPNPERRITLPELKARILACSKFTEQPAATLPTPPASPEPTPVYVNNCEESAIDDEFDYPGPLSPATSDSMSDDGSTCSSDEGSLTSSCSTIEDLEEDDYLDDIPEARTLPPQQSAAEPAIYEPDGPRLMPYSQEYLHPYAVLNLPSSGIVFCAYKLPL